MGHMKDYKRNATLVVAFAAVLSISTGFLPEATAQTTTLTATLGLFCGFSIVGVITAVAVTPPTPAVFTIDMTNNGNMHRRIITALQETYIRMELLMIRGY